MNLTIAYCLVASFTMGVVFLLDAFMQLRGVYARASQPIFMSSIFALLPVPILFSLGEVSLIPFKIIVISFFGGVVLMLADWIYLRILYDPQGDTIEDTLELSFYDCGSPILLVLYMGLINLFGFKHYEEMTKDQMLGSLVVIGGVILLSAYGKKKGNVRFKRHIALLVFAISVAGFQLIEDFSISIAMKNDSSMTLKDAFLGITPWFCIGFSSGMGVLLIRKERNHFWNQLPVIFENKKIILFSELIAIISFLATLGSLGSGHVVLVAAVTGSYPVVVLLGGIILRKRHPDMIEFLPSLNYLPVKIIATIAVIYGTTIAAR